MLATFSTSTSAKAWPISKGIRPLILLGLCLMAASETSAQKAGTVDMNRAFKEYRKTREAEAKINEAKNAAKKEYDERASAYKKALDEINKLNQQLESPTLNTEARIAKAKERDEAIARLKNMEREINEFRQTREQQLQQQLLRMQEGIVKEITEVVMECVKAKDIDLVFDKSGASLNGFSPILFSRESSDLTVEVIAVLNKPERAPGMAGSEPPRATPAGAATASPLSTKTPKP